MTDIWQHRLSEYLDGELAPAEREALEQHLSTCANCTAILGQLRLVIDRARSLEDRVPSRDLWPGVAARIGDRAAASPSAATERRLSSREHRAPVVHSIGRERPATAHALERRRLSRSIPQLAAAVIGLLLVGGGAVWLAHRAPGSAAPTRSTAELRAPGTSLEPVPAATTGAMEVPAGAYDAAVAELERALAEGRSRLAPSTVRALEQNLRIIDQAIGDARRALASDPANAYVSNHLADTMRRKVELLRRANLLASTRT